jgi:LPXTG-motif cell wall-anchored protein
MSLVLMLGLLVGLSTASLALAQGQSTSVELSGQNNSGMTGTATLTDLGGGKMRVEMRVSGAGSGPQPAHIHEGTCAQLNPAPKFALAEIVNGASRTDVDGSLQTVLASPHAIHMHKSPDELPIYVACADIRMSSGQPATLPRSGEATTSMATVAGLAIMGFALMFGGYALCRRSTS